MMELGAGLANGGTNIGRIYVICVKGIAYILVIVATALGVARATIPLKSEAS